MKYLRGLLLPALLGLASSAAAAKDGPLVETTPFSNELVNLMYFDDSGVALTQELETGNIWRSHDAGKGWKQIKDMYGLGVLKSPFDNKVALVLSIDKHWITYDRGETWRSFTTERPPSPAGPVSWHAQDSKKIMIHEIEDCFTAACLAAVQSPFPISGFSPANALSDLLHRRRFRVGTKVSHQGPPYVPMGQGLRTNPRRQR
jgi:hypothetical protein